MLGVPPERLTRWLDGVASRHGPFTDVRVDDGGVVHVSCADTTTFSLAAPFGWTPGTPPLAAFGAAAEVARRAAVLLVRRGRWAVGVFAGADLVVSKVDSRQVQGRTAAGGWSQQRFARRRGNQTDAVLTATADTAARVLLPHAGTLDALVTGGDHGAVEAVLADTRLAPLRPLVSDRFLAVPDPKRAVLETAPALYRNVRIRVVDP